MCSYENTSNSIYNVLAPNSLQRTVESLADMSYIGIFPDGSNHQAMKICPVLIQFFDKTGEITQKLAELATVSDEKADTCFSVVTKTLGNLNLRNKCIAFDVVNRTSSNNVFQHLKKSLGEEILNLS